MAKKVKRAPRRVSPQAESNGHGPVAEVQLPIGAYPECVPDGLTHIDIRLHRDHSRALRLLMEGLDKAGERLQSGRRVTSQVDSVRWLMDQILASEAGQGALRDAGFVVEPE